VVDGRRKARLLLSLVVVSEIADSNRSDGGILMSTDVKGHSTSGGAVVGPEAGVSGLGALFNELMEEHGYVTRTNFDANWAQV
jgi:hypothetical protein